MMLCGRRHPAVDFQSKPDAHQIQGSVQRRGIRAIYHFTHIRNLPSIFKHGILSRSEMSARDIPYDKPPTTWGSPWKADEFEDYICCGITRPWGMMSNEEGPLAVFCLNPHLLWREGTIYTAKHAGWGDVTLTDISAEGTCEHFDALFASSTDGLPSPTHADVLVYKAVPQSAFYRLYFAHDESNNAARGVCDHLRVPDGRHIWEVIPFDTKPLVFPPFRQE